MRLSGLLAAIFAFSNYPIDLHQSALSTVKAAVGCPFRTNEFVTRQGERPSLRRAGMTIADTFAFTVVAVSLTVIFVRLRRHKRNLPRQDEEC